MPDRMSQIPKRSIFMRILTMLFPCLVPARRVRGFPQDGEASGERIAELEESNSPLLQPSQCAQTEIERLRTQVEQERQARIAVVEATNELEARLREAEEDKKAAAARAMGMEKTIADLKALLETRTADFNVAKTFLTKASRYSGREVKDKVDELNWIVFQIGAQLSDTPQYGAKVERANIEYLNPDLLDAIRHFNHSENSILVQSALQTVMVWYLYRLVTSWDFTGEHEEFCRTIYVQLREKGPEAVAGRWRAMCRTSIRECANAEDLNPQHHANNLISVLLHVLAACGAVRPPGAANVLSDATVNHLRTSLSDLVELALKLRQIIGEEIVSPEFLLQVVPPNVVFDSAVMDDEWAGPRPLSADHTGIVLCTTSLGLIVEENNAGRVQTKVLLKPKAVLKSIVDQHS